MACRARRPSATTTTTLSTDAWDVLARHAPRLAELEAATQRFVSAFWSSDLSAGGKGGGIVQPEHAAQPDLLPHRATGNPFGWEGCLDDAGCCLGSCTHVWNYELATGYLFGGLARQMRELEYQYATADDGGDELPDPAAAGQGPGVPAGRGRRAVRLRGQAVPGVAAVSGDDEWLRRLWPACRRSIEFAWIEGGWDADRDGLAEGAQHNTMDVEYYGPTPVIQSWYLAALAAAAADGRGGRRPRVRRDLPVGARQRAAADRGTAVQRARTTSSR